MSAAGLLTAGVGKLCNIKSEDKRSFDQLAVLPECESCYWPGEARVQEEQLPSN